MSYFFFDHQIPTDFDMLFLLEDPLDSLFSTFEDIEYSEIITNSIRLEVLTKLHGTLDKLTRQTKEMLEGEGEYRKELLSELKP